MISRRQSKIEREFSELAVVKRVSSAFFPFSLFYTAKLTSETRDNEPYFSLSSEIARVNCDERERLTEKKNGFRRKNEGKRSKMRVRNGPKKVSRRLREKSAAKAAKRARRTQKVPRSTLSARKREKDKRTGKLREDSRNPCIQTGKKRFRYNNRRRNFRTG